MKLKNETIFNKAKQLRYLIKEGISSSAEADTYTKEKLLSLSDQIPLQIGLSLNLPLIECTRLHLEKAERKLIELCIIIDLCTSENLQLDSDKLNSLVEEILELIPITLQSAEEAEQKRINNFMKEFMVK